MRIAQFHFIIETELKLWPPRISAAHVTEIPSWLSPLVPIRNSTNLNISLGRSWRNSQPLNWIQVGPWTHIKQKGGRTGAAVWPPLPVKTLCCSRVNLFLPTHQHYYMLLPNKLTFQGFRVNHSEQVISEGGGGSWVQEYNLTVTCFNKENKKQRGQLCVGSGTLLAPCSAAHSCDLSCLSSPSWHKGSLAANWEPVWLMLRSASQL